MKQVIPFLERQSIHSLAFSGLGLRNDPEVSNEKRINARKEMNSPKLLEDCKVVIEWAEQSPTKYSSDDEQP